MYERELLKAFGFIVHAEHPHNFVINYVHFLGAGKELMQLAWNILNDRYEGGHAAPRGPQ